MDQSSFGEADSCSDDQEFPSPVMGLIGSWLCSQDLCPCVRVQFTPLHPVSLRLVLLLLSCLIQDLSSTLITSVVLESSNQLTTL